MAEGLRSQTELKEAAIRPVAEVMNSKLQDITDNISKMDEKLDNKFSALLEAIRSLTSGGVRTSTSSDRCTHYQVLQPLVHDLARMDKRPLSDGVSDVVSANGDSDEVAASTIPSLDVAPFNGLDVKEEPFQFDLNSSIDTNLPQNATDVALVEIESEDVAVEQSKFELDVVTTDTFEEDEKSSFKSGILLLRSTIGSFCIQDVRQNVYEILSSFLPPAKPPDDFMNTVKGLQCKILISLGVKDDKSNSWCYLENSIEDWLCLVSTIVGFNWNSDDKALMVGVPAVCDDGELICLVTVRGTFSKFFIVSLCKHIENGTCVRYTKLIHIDWKFVKSGSWCLKHKWKSSFVWIICYLLHINMDLKDHVSWNTMLSGLAPNGMYIDVLSFFQDMVNSGVKLDQVSILSVTMAAGRLGKLLYGKEVHTYALKHGFCSDLKVGNTLLDMYAKCSSVVYMSRIYDAMQMDGQTEVVNRCLEMYLHCRCSDRPHLWSRWLPLAEWWYNTTFHSAAQVTPFEVMYDYAPPTHLPYLLGESTVDVVVNHLRDRENMISVLQFHLRRAQHRMKQIANRLRNDRSFTIRDWVFVQHQAYRHHSVALRINQKLAPQYFDPYKIIVKCGAVAYKLELPSYSRNQTVFHVSQLKKHVDTTLTSNVLPSDVPELFIKEPEKVFERRLVNKNGKAAIQVLIKGAIVLGGRAGTRLFPLTSERAKPAVPIGGCYRLIDVPTSNCINSGIKKIFVLTQFNSFSLNRHLCRAYNFGSGVSFRDGFFEVLAATQTSGDTGKRWFQGTADAVRQFMCSDISYLQRVRLNAHEKLVLYFLRAKPPDVNMNGVTILNLNTTVQCAICFGECYWRTYHGLVLPSIQRGVWCSEEPPWPPDFPKHHVLDCTTILKHLTINTTRSTRFRLRSSGSIYCERIKGWTNEQYKVPDDFMNIALPIDVTDCDTMLSMVNWCIVGARNSTWPVKDLTMKTTSSPRFRFDASKCGELMLSVKIIRVVCSMNFSVHQQLELVCFKCYCWVDLCDGLHKEIHYTRKGKKFILFFSLSRPPEVPTFEP